MPAIEVTNLTKRYGARTAVDDISFTVDDGEIVGFLGPNGAGKTTTLRVLTCFQPATSGTTKVAAPNNPSGTAGSGIAGRWTEAWAASGPRSGGGSA